MTFSTPTIAALVLTSIFAAFGLAAIAANHWRKAGEDVANDFTDAADDIHLADVLLGSLLHGRDDVADFHDSDLTQRGQRDHAS